jgi:TonB family protein
MALAAKVQGAVVLEARIEPDGRVGEVQVLRSIPLLDQAAIDAVRQWAYTPTLLNGQPVPVVMTVTVQFSLRPEVERVPAIFEAAAPARTSSTVQKPGNGVSAPRATRQVKPEYTAEAMDQRIEGTVLLSVVVRADGSVGDVNVTQSLDSVYGLDAMAVEAMKQWEFTPGTKDGQPVDVAVTVEMTFTLK